MTKLITIKLTKASYRVGPFDISDQQGNVIATDVPVDTLITGITYSVSDTVLYVTLKSTGKCKLEVTHVLEDITKYEYDHVELDEDRISCLWAHNKDHTIYNSFYGTIEPFIIEYPFAYQYKDQIVQSVEEHDKVFKYFKNRFGFNDKNNVVQVDDIWFNKAVLYNGQQSSGILLLAPKPVGNMKEYLQYPKFNADSKSIIWTKSDNMYQYNTFWSLVKEKSSPLFTTTCVSLSIDKVVNQTNMDYSLRAYRKDTLRAKGLKIRHILDDRSDVKLVSQFIIAPAQISHK